MTGRPRMPDSERLVLLLSGVYVPPATADAVRYWSFQSGRKLAAEVRQLLVEAIEARERLVVP